MNHFKNEFRKNFSKLTCILFYVIVVLYMAIGFIGRIVLTNLYDDVPFADYNAISYCSTTTTALIGIIVIFSILSIANTFSVDYTQYTWKNLLCTGTDKNKVQLAKFAFAFAQSFFYLLTTYLLSFIVGCIAYGFDKEMKHTSSTFSLINIEYIDYTESAWENLAKMFINNVFILIFFVGFIALIAELFKGSKHTIVLSFLLYYASSIVSGVLLAIVMFKKELKWLMYLPFTFTNPGFIPPLRNEMLLFNGISLVYTIIFFAIALLLFRKRDIQTSK